jgi:membrane protease YdiL (CAAX protease family)
VYEAPFQLSDELLEPPPPTRGWVWLVAIAFIILACASALSAIGASGHVTEDRKQLDRVLAALEMDEIQAGLTGGGEAFLRHAEARLMAVPLTTAGAKGVRARSLLILQQEYGRGKPDFSGLNTAADDILDEDGRQEVTEHRKVINRCLKQLYGTPNLSRAQAAEIRASLRAYASDWPLTLAAARAVQEPTSSSAVRKSGQAMAGLAMLAVILLGVAAWLGYFIYVLSGRKTGVPLEGQGAAVGDLLGLRLLAFFLVFSVVPCLFLPLVGKGRYESPWLSVYMSLAILASLALIMRSSLGGRRLSLRDIGFGSRRGFEDVLWGIGAWAANWIPLIALVLLGRALFSWVPSGKHPIQAEMLEPSAWLPVSIGAVLLAPMIEEIAFRGLFFQGLYLRFRRFWPAALISAISFAAIHPQGGQLWLALGWVGFMGALLTRERGSLVPSMVMHGLHNATVIVLSIMLQVP